MHHTAPAQVRSGRRLIFTVIAFLAMTAQLAVALSPLAEGRERSWGSHVEAAGLSKHFAHSEATCAACQARSIHGTTRRVQTPVLVVQHVELAQPERALAGFSVDHYPKDNPRAPPTVI